MADSSNYKNRQLEEKIDKFDVRSRADLRKQYLTDADIDYIIRELLIKKQCSMLWLVENHITSKSISNLSLSLENNDTLEGLSLCDNDMDDSDVVNIARVLSKPNSKLKRLALTSNNITDQGVQHLAEMLNLNRSLSQLWLGFNQITDHGVAILVDVLVRHNQTLQILSLSWNKLITDASIDSLIYMFEHNKTLRTVSLSNCDLSEQGKLQLKKATNLHKEFFVDL